MFGFPYLELKFHNNQILTFIFGINKVNLFLTKCSIFIIYNKLHSIKVFYY